MKIFITGGTSGIGLAIAKLYLSRGHEVAITGRDLSKVEKSLWEQYSGKLVGYELDVREREELKRVVKEFAPDGLDIMIANAGRSVGSKTKLPNFDASREVLDINIFGVLNSFEAALDGMIKNQKGHLVATASVAGMVGLPGASSYSASKAAVLKLCESYSLDLRSQGINVTAIAPGFIDTPLTRKNDHKMPFLMHVDEAAKVIARGLEKREHLIVFPWQMKAVMYLLDRMPRALYRKVMSLKVANYSK